MTFSNVGDIMHTATAAAGPDGATTRWDTGPLEKGQSKTITFKELGTYYYICTVHPWMYGEVFVVSP